ncbi:hypothetical protein ACFO0N_15655 [Halobium salinum]|uniref:Ig-like domain-containing protein n=1 Tax=Halobium salinum TaxID=1364940 RepID=A0ABD5PF42_9EURY|nr:hypothetical protein [Halobium salinum]
MVPSSRRRLLRLSGVAALPLLAGCTDTPFEQPRGAQVVNDDDTDHEVTVTVVVDGDTKIDERLDVAAGETATVDRQLPGPGLLFARQFEAGARLENGETASASAGFCGSDGFDEVEVYVDDGSVSVEFADGV